MTIAQAMRWVERNRVNVSRDAWSESRDFRWRAQWYGLPRYRKVLGRTFLDAVSTLRDRVTDDTRLHAIWRAKRAAKKARSTP